MAGRPEAGMRPGEGGIVANSVTLGEILRYRPCTPGADFEGDIEALSMWAGQGAALVSRLQPAAEIVREIHTEALAVLKQLGTISA
jgi:NAD(P)H-dependent flavin oxidoreductase YrpB (nitropropane dioxygenase family)